MGHHLKEAAKALVGRKTLRRVGTSLSDDDAYPQFCLDASSDYRVFHQFRQSRVYRKILEHVSEEQGQAYLDLLSEDSEVLAAIDRFLANDLHGGPTVFEYPGVGAANPTTLRYVKVLADLKQCFGSLDGMDVAEIGVGYGGQCRVINGLYAPGRYTLIDLQPALALAQRYLDHYVLNGTTEYRTANELEPREYDLVISNYAFTELPRVVQDRYLERVLSRSKRGYITYNPLTPEEYRSYTADELVAMLPDARIEEERPLTYPGNCVIVWG